MSKKQVELIKAETQKALGRELSDDIFQKALAKAKRWMKNAYGSVDLEEYIAESGGSIAGYYTETEERPDGLNTFNRQTMASRGRS